MLPSPLCGSGVPARFLLVQVRSFLADANSFYRPFRVRFQAFGDHPCPHESRLGASWVNRTNMPEEYDPALSATLADLNGLMTMAR
jgi:hypothetical protein